jgi:hypothetical protein
LTLAVIFLCFEVVLGLRINLRKFELVAIGAVEDVEVLAHILGCQVASLPMKYLSLLLIGHAYLEWRY